MPEYVIRLVGPWKVEWCDPLPAPATVRLPREWRSLFGETRGRARFARLFHQPTNLEPHERVWLEFTGVRGTGTVMLNEHVVGEVIDTQSTVRFDITERLQPSNVVSVELTFDPTTTNEPGGLYDVVRLVITS